MEVSRLSIVPKTASVNAREMISLYALKSKAGKMILGRAVGIVPIVSTSKCRYRLNGVSKTRAIRGLGTVFERALGVKNIITRVRLARRKASVFICGRCEGSVIRICTTEASLLSPR